MKILSTAFVIALCVGATFSPAQAQSIGRFGSDVVVPPGRHVEDVFSAGGDVRIEGRAEGDVVTLGGHAVVPGAVEGSLLTAGGDADIDGVVEGDVATMGGDIVIRGRVQGDVATAGGDIRLDGVVEGDVSTHGGKIELGPDARVEGERVSTTPEHDSRLHFDVDDHEETTIGSVTSYVVRRGVFFALIFLLALGMRHFAERRFDLMQVALVRQPVRASLLGSFALFAAAIGVPVLAVTVVGIPVALMGALGLFLAAYVGLGVAASVLGAALPIRSLGDEDAKRIGAGVGALFLTSLVPMAGTFALVVASLWGLGAVVLTRFGSRSGDRVSVGEGPYRTAA